MAAVSLLSLAAAGDWAVITGASTGIGRQLALEAAREGYNVVLTARRAPLLQKLAAEIEAEHAVATRVCAGCLTDAKFVERLRDAAPGSVSLLVAVTVAVTSLRVRRWLLSLPCRRRVLL